MSESVQTFAVADHVLEGIVDALAGPGWCEVPGFLPPVLVEALRAECRTAWSRGAFHPAGIGQGSGHQVRSEIRSDHVLWLDDQAPTAAQIYLAVLDQLRCAINRELFLGLFDYEGHFAVYPPGSFYAKHLDQFRGVEARTVTAVLYLNEAWRAEEGGQLRLFTENGAPVHDVLPEAGTLACFLSGRFPHEVLPATRERLAITGWFKRR